MGLTPDAVTMIGAALAMVAAGLVKRVSGGVGSRLHRILSPCAAVIVGTLVQYLGGNAESALGVFVNGPATGLLAVGLHSAAKNVDQHVRAKGSRPL